MGKSVGQILGAIMVVASFFYSFGATLVIGAYTVHLGTLAMLITGLNLLFSKQPNLAQKMAGNGHLINTRSTNEPVPITYGLMRVGGNQVFITTTGSDNKVLHIVMSLAEGPIQSIDEVYLDDKLITDPLYSGKATYYSKTGEMDQAVFAELNASYPAFTDPMIGTALLYVKLTYNQDTFQGVPLITALIKGRKVYDPRTETSVYSTNPALVASDLMTNRYGMARDGSLVNTQSVIDCANWCDANSYTFNGLINSQDNAQDQMELVLANFRGFCIWTGSQYKFGIYDFDSPVMSLTENDMVADSFTIDLPGLPETPNKIKVKFIDPEQKYTVKDFDFAAQDVLTLEGSEREAELMLIGTTSYQQAVDLATYAYERARLNKGFSFVAGRKAVSLEPGDIITVTHTLPGWIAQEVRVLTVSIQPDQTVALTCQMETELLYDRKLNVTTHALYEGTFFDPTSTPPGVSSVTLTEVVVASKERTFSRLSVAFTVPDYVWWAHVDAYVSNDGTNYNFFGSFKNNFTIEPCEEGVIFYVKLQSVTIYGVRADYSTLTVWSKEIIGKQTLPSDVTNFSAIAVGDQINFKWDEAVDFDIVGYEIRRGDSWASGVKIALIQSALSYLAVGVKPGEHTFYIKAKDSLQQYSANEASKAVTVLYPSNYVDKYSWTTDFNEGAHQNTGYKDDGTYGRVLYNRSWFVSNGSFTTDTIWGKDAGFTISGGQLVGNAVGDKSIWENPAAKFMPGAIYEVTFTISSYVSGSLYGYMQDNSSHSVLTTARSADGTFTQQLTFPSNAVATDSHYLGLWCDNGFVGNVDNLSITLISPLKGIWTSASKDMTALKDMRFWLNYLIVLLGDEATWEGRYSAGDTWEALASDLSWAAIFEPVEASAIEVDLMVSDDNTNWTIISHMHIFSAEVNCRYVKYRITINDLSAGAYLYVKPATLVGAYWA